MKFLIGFFIFFNAVAQDIGPSLEMGETESVSVQVLIELYKRKNSSVKGLDLITAIILSVIAYMSLYK